MLAGIPVLEGGDLGERIVRHEGGFMWIFRELLSQVAGSAELTSCQAPVDLVCVRCPADVRHRADYSPKQFGPSLDGFAKLM